MATLNASRHGGSLTLTAGERFVLRELAGVYSTSVGEAVEHAGNADELDAAVEVARVHAALMRASEDGVLHLSPGVVERLRYYREQTVETLAYERRCLRSLRAGDLGKCFPDTTPAESEARTQRYIDDELEQLSVCDSLLARAVA